MTLLAALAIAAPVPAPPTEPLPPGAVARLGTTRFRLGDGVGRVTPSPCGKWLVALNTDHSGSDQPVVATVLDARTGLRTAQITVKDNNWCLRTQPAASGDGRRLVVVGPNHKELAEAHANRLVIPRNEFLLNEVRCYDLTTGKLAWRSSVWENALAASRPGGDELAYCSRNRVIVADFANGEKVTSWECPGGAVWGMAWADEGVELVTIGADRAARVWNAKTGKELRKVPDAVAAEKPADRPKPGQFPEPQPTGGLGAWSISPNGRWLAAVDGADVRLIDLKAGRIARTEEYTDEIYEVAVSNDGQTLATRHRDGSAIRLRNTKLGRTRELDAGWKGLTAQERDYPTFSADGKTLFVPWGAAIRSWDAESGRETTPGAKFLSTSEEVRFSPDGLQVRTGTRHGKQIDDLWDARTGRHLKREQHDYAAFRGPPGSWLGVRYIPLRGVVVELYRTDTGEAVRDLAGKVRRLGWFGFSLDGSRVFAQENDRAIVWDVATGRVLLDRAGKAPGATEIIGLAGKAGRWLAIRERGALVVVDLATKAERVLVKDTLGVAFGGNYLVASVREKDKFRYRVWNLDTDDEIADPFGPPRDTFEGKLHFAPNGKTVARLMEDGRTVTVHDWPSAKLRQRLTGTARIESTAFSADRKRMATTQRDTTTLIWDIGSQK